MEVNREQAIALAGDRRVRIWEVYLAGCAHAFSRGWIYIYQVLACKAGNAAAIPLPLTREYMYRDDSEDGRAEG
jgi:cyclopropane-fatty-acyl-phospholipid synthase